MTSFAKITGDAVERYPYTLAHLRADHPDVSFPRAFSGWEVAYGVQPVIAVDRPAPSDPLTKNVVEGNPTLIGGQWTQSWQEEDASSEEVAARRQEAADKAARAQIKADAFVAQFIAMTPAEVANYVDNNTANLAAARALLKKMALMLLLLARQEFGT